MRRTQLKQLVEKYGGTLTPVDKSHPDWECEAIAPQGFHWSGDGLHAVLGIRHDGDRIGDMYADMYSRVEFGIEYCSKTTCECYDTRCTYHDE